MNELSRSRRIFLCGMVSLLSLAFSATSYRPAGAAFSGRNGKIVYWGGGFVTSHIYRMNADGTNKVQLTRGDHTDSNPVWSPNGRKIVFNRNGHIFKMRADGSNRQRLTSGPEQYLSPSWSNNGRRIVFASDRGPGADLDIFHMAANGTDIQNVTDDVHDDYDPVWNPVHGSIAYTSFREQLQIRVVNVDGSENGSWDADPEGSFAPDWHPSGNKVVFTRGGPQDNEIWTTNGFNADRITNTPADEASPVFSPTGAKILFEVSDRLWVMSANGNNRNRLSNSGPSQRDPDWQPR